MSRTVRFKRFVSAELVPGDAVYLFSERQMQVRLQGKLVERLMPLLAGKHDRDDIVATLSPEFTPERVHKVLDRLIRAGHVVEVEADIDARTAGFWEMCQLDGDTAIGELANRKVDVVCLGDLDADGFTEAAATLGLTVDADEADLTVVFVDNYLHPALLKYNNESLAKEKAWLLAKPLGATIWVGPVFEPDRTACWQCLASRLSSNQMLISFLMQRTGRTSPPVTSIADLALTQHLATQLTALHAAKWLTGAFGARSPIIDAPLIGQSEVFTLDTVTLQSKRHLVQRRPQCAACGEPDLQARSQNRPVYFVSRPKIATTDGGHRARTPDALLAEYEPFVSPITGAVKELLRVPPAADGLYSYHAGQNFAVPMANIGDLRAGLRSAASGKGMSDAQAKASALAEAIERYSGVYRGDEAKISATKTELGDDAIEPNALHLFSERQLAERAWWNAKGSHFQRVCDPFDPSQRIDWTPIWSLSRQHTKYLPTAALFFGYPLPAGNIYAGADSNGNAAGSSIEDAALQGFFELVERDSVAIWWYNMLRKPAIDLASFDVPYFDSWQQRYRTLNREIWALDVTTDLGIPSVVTVSRRIDKPVEDILLAFGAHFDVKIAISRAMTEMNQFLPAVVNVTADSDEYAFPDPDQQHWWRTATVANQPYLLPADQTARTAADYRDVSTDDLAEDMRIAQSIVEKADMEMLILDQTRPDIGLPVVKVIVPGMRHFWTRFGPGRLYDVPVRMGALPTPTPESELNPIGMFL